MDPVSLVDNIENSFEKHFISQACMRRDTISLTLPVIVSTAVWSVSSTGHYTFLADGDVKTGTGCRVCRDFRHES
jgi:hypothetical protein